MGPKKSRSVSTGNGKRKIVRTTIELKREIIAKFDNCVHVSALAAQCSMARSTISTFPMNKESIDAADVANGVTIVHSMQRPHFDKRKRIGWRHYY